MIYWRSPAIASQQSEEFICEYQGQLKIQLVEDLCRLGPGVSAYFGAAMLDRLASRGDESLRFVSVITPAVS